MAEREKRRRKRRSRKEKKQKGEEAEKRRRERERVWKKASGQHARGAPFDCTRHLRLLPLLMRDIEELTWSNGKWYCPERTTALRL